MTSKEKPYYYYDESDKPSNVGISGVRPRRLHQRISRNKNNKKALENIFKCFFY